MTAELKHQLQAAINSAVPVEEIVALLRQYKEKGVTQAEVYSFLEELHRAAPDEPTDDRILEIADFAAGFCAPHMKVWSCETR